MEIQKYQISDIKNKIINKNKVLIKGWICSACGKVYWKKPIYGRKVLKPKK